MNLRAAQIAPPVKIFNILTMFDAFARNDEAIKIITVLLAIIGNVVLKLSRN